MDSVERRDEILQQDVRGGKKAKSPAPEAIIRHQGWAPNRMHEARNSSALWHVPHFGIGQLSIH